MWSGAGAGTPPLLVQTGWVLSPVLCCQSGEVGAPHCACALLCYRSQLKRSSSREFTDAML